MISKNIDDMQSTYQNTKDFSQITDLLDSGFQSIRSSVQLFHKNEQANQSRAEEQIKQLQLDLSNTQKKSLDLHASLKSVSEKSQKDSLTGLFNRGSYEVKMDHFITRVKILEEPLILAVADIDHFKSINDNYGHLSGDQVLRDIAKLIKDNVRQGDFVARYGGEEFVIVLDNIEEKVALKILNKMRQRIEKYPFILKGKEIFITTSIGFTLINSTDSKESSFSRADDALYKAKLNGRNQVIKL